MGLTELGGLQRPASCCNPYVPTSLIPNPYIPNTYVRQPPRFAVI